MCQTATHAYTWEAIFTSHRISGENFSGSLPRAISKNASLKSKLCLPLQVLQSYNKKIKRPNFLKKLFFHLCQLTCTQCIRPNIDRHFIHSRRVRAMSKADSMSAWEAVWLIRGAPGAERSVNAMRSGEGFFLSWAMAARR